MIFIVLVTYLFIDIRKEIMAQPPPAVVEVIEPLPDDVVPLFPDLKFTSIVKTNDVYTYDLMIMHLQQLLAHYPLLYADIIGESVEGRALYLLTLGTGPKKILLDGSHHGNEWISSFLLMTMIEHYAYYYHTGQPCYGVRFGNTLLSSESRMPRYDLRELLSQVTLYFVPMLNPDGVEIVATNGKSSPNYDWLLRVNGSTNFQGWKANARGVDLNRQYPTNWHLARNYGPPQPARANHAGSAPATEPEVKALLRLLEQEVFQAHASYHSVGNVLFYNYHQQGEQLNRDQSLVNALSRLTGYPVRHSSGGIGGLTKDHVVTALQIPSIIVELGLNKPRPLPEFANMWQRNRCGPLLMAEWVLENADRLP